MAGKWQSRNAVLSKTGAHKFYTIGLVVLARSRKTSIPPPWLFPHLCLLMMRVALQFLLWGGGTYFPCSEAGLGHVTCVSQ